MKCPMLLLAGSFAAGILLADPSRASAVFWIAAGAGLLLLAAVAARKDVVRAAGALAVAGFVCAGAASASLFPYRFPSNHISHLSEWGLNTERPLTLKGTLASTPLRMPYGIQFDLAVASVSTGQTSHSARGIARMRVLNGDDSPLPAAALRLHYGESIRVLARLRPPQNERNPGGFDYRRWVERIHDVYWQGIAEGPKAVSKIPGPPPPLIRRVIEGARQRLLASIDRLYPPWSIQGRDGAVLKAVLLGDRSSLDSTTIEDFRKSGLYHLLVVAGLHVGLLALLAEGLLRLLRLRELQRAVLLLLFLGVYALLVEQRAPTMRASLMIGAYLLARLFDRAQSALNAIGIAALVLLLHRPAWLFDSGFQLSFATALLIAGLAVPILVRVTEPFRRATRRLAEPLYDLAFEPRVAQFRLDLRDFAGVLSGGRGATGWRAEAALKGVTGSARLTVWFVDLLLFSAILQLGLLLPMAAIFHRVTLAGIGLNALAVPLMTVLLAIAVPVVLLNLAAPALAAIPAKLLALVMHGLFALTEAPHMPHWLSFRVPEPPAWIGWCFALAVIAAALGLRHNRGLFAAAAGCAIITGVLIAWSPFSPGAAAGQFEVTALDCGGGEALYLALPGGETVLVGAGGGRRRWLSGGDPFRARRWDPGENIVSPYLWSRRVKSISVLLLPDASGDHLRGVAAVLRNFRVRQFWYGAPPRGAYAGALWAMLRRRGVTVRHLREGSPVMLGQTRFTVLWSDAGRDPFRPRSTREPVLIRVSNREGSVLLGASLNRENQKMALRGSINLGSTVIESRTAGADSAFISRVDPAVVIETSESRATETPSTGEAAFPKILNVERLGALTVAMHNGAVRILDP